MKHDLAHEVAQDEAILKLAHALASVAAKCGEMGALKDAHDVVLAMQKDEAEPEVVAAERVTPAAEFDWADEVDVKVGAKRK